MIKYLLIFFMVGCGSLGVSSYEAKIKVSECHHTEMSAFKDAMRRVVIECNESYSYSFHSMNRCIEDDGGMGYRYRLTYQCVTQIEEGEVNVD